MNPLPPLAVFLFSVLVLAGCVQPPGLEPIRPPRAEVHGRVALGQVLERRRDVVPETEDEAAGYTASGGAWIAVDPDDPDVVIGFEIEGIGSTDDVFPTQNEHQGTEGFAYAGILSGDGDPWRVITRLGFTVGGIESESAVAGAGSEWDYVAPIRAQFEPRLEVLRRQEMQVALFGLAGGSLLVGDGRVGNRSSELFGAGYEFGGGVRLRFTEGPFVALGYERRGYLFDDQSLNRNPLTETVLEFQGVGVTVGFGF